MRISSLCQIETTQYRIVSILEDVRHVLATQQSADGSWSYLLEGSVLPDSYAIIVETLFPPTDHGIVESLATGIERRQLPNGGSGSTRSIPATSAPRLKLTWLCGWQDVRQTLQSFPRARDFLLAMRDEQHSFEFDARHLGRPGHYSLVGSAKPAPRDHAAVGKCALEPL